MEPNPIWKRTRNSITGRQVWLTVEKAEEEARRGRRIIYLAANVYERALCCPLQQCQI